MQVGSLLSSSPGEDITPAAIAEVDGDRVRTTASSNGLCCFRGLPCDRSHRDRFTGKVDEVPADTSTLISRTAKEASEQVVCSFQAMQGNIHAYASYTLNAFRQMAGLMRQGDARILAERSGSALRHQGHG